MRFGAVLDMFLDYYEKACASPIVRKPISWALYQTWKIVDGLEKPRILEVDAEKAMKILDDYFNKKENEK